MISETLVENDKSFIHIYIFNAPAEGDCVGIFVLCYFDRANKCNRWTDRITAANTVLVLCKQYCMVKTCSLLCFNGEVFITITFDRTSHHIDSVDFGIVFFQLQQTMVSLVTNCHDIEFYPTILITKSQKQDTS